MAYDKIIDSAQLDANLTSVANAIRSKNGTKTQLTFPDGFVSAINALQTSTTFTIGTVDLHDVSADIANTYLESGVETAYTGWKTTDYIPIAANAVYAFAADISNSTKLEGRYCAVYSASKDYVKKLDGGIASAGSGSFCLWKSDADGYIRVSGVSAAVEKFKMYLCSGAVAGM